MLSQGNIKHSPTAIINTYKKAVPQLLCFSPDRKILAAVLSDDTNKVRFWDVVSNPQKQPTLISKLSVITAITFSPDNQLFFIAGENRIYLYKNNNYTQADGMLDLLTSDISLIIDVTFLDSDPNTLVIISEFYDDYYYKRIDWNLKTKKIEYSSRISKQSLIEQQIIKLQLPNCYQNELIETEIRRIDDGQIVVLATRQNYISILKFWDMIQQQYIREMCLDNNKVITNKLSADGRAFACGYTNGIIQIWKEIICPQLTTILYPANMLDFYSDNSFIFCNNQKIYSFNLQSQNNENLKLICMSQFKITKIILHKPDNADAWLVAAISNNTIILSSYWCEELKKIKTINTKYPVSCIVFSLNSQYLLYSNSNNEFGGITVLDISDIDSGDVQRINTIVEKNSHEKTITTICFLANQRLVTGGDDNYVIIWEGNYKVSNNCKPKRKILLSNACLAISVSANKELLASNDGNDIRIWNTKHEDYPEVPRLSEHQGGHKDLVTDLQFSPQAAILASGSYDGSVKIWNTNTFTLLSNLLHTGNPVKALSFSHNGSKLAAAYGSYDKNIKVWDIPLISHLETTKPLNSRVLCS